MSTSTQFTVIRLEGFGIPPYSLLDSSEFERAMSSIYDVLAADIAELCIRRRESLSRLEGYGRQIMSPVQCQKVETDVR